MTRAQERLTLIHASARSLYGGRSYNLPSRFLDELPDPEVERERLRPASWSGYGARGRSRRAATCPSSRPATTSGTSTFGEGVVTRIEPGIVSVRFADGSERQLALDYAPLERL